MLSMVKTVAGRVVLTSEMTLLVGPWVFWGRDTMLGEGPDLAPLGPPPSGEGLEGNTKLVAHSG